MTKKNKAKEKETSETEQELVKTDSDTDIKDSLSQKDQELADAAQDDKEETEETVESLEIDYSKKYEEINDKYLRLVAEYDNFRKRTQKEKDALYNESVIDVCKAWLPVLDNLDRAIDAAEKLVNPESKTMADGIELVKKQALETMSSFGVEEIDCLGKSFDPEYHDAVAHVDDDAYGENEIIDVLQKGYIKDDRVIRHSVVRVAN